MAGLFTVTVASLTRGWSYSTVEGDVPNPALKTHLGDDLTYKWSFDAELVPGDLDPAEGTVRFACASMPDVPALEKGDYLTLSVRLGTAGVFILTPPPMRVATVESVVDDGSGWPVTVTVTLVDELSSLRVLYPQPYPVGVDGKFHRTMRWRERFAHLAYNISRKITAPTWWGADERPPQMTNQNFPTTQVGGLAIRSNTEPWSESAWAMLTQLVHSHQPASLTHTLMAGYTAAGPAVFPTGTQRVGPQGSNWGFNIPGDPGPAVAFSEPQTTHCFHVVPASRRTDSLVGQPLVFVVRSGVLTVSSNVVGALGHTQLALDARATSLPVKLRKSREHFMDQVKVSGREFVRKDVSDLGVYVEGARTLVNPLSSSVVTNRDIDTQLDLGHAVGSYYDAPPGPTSSPGLPLVAAAYLTDASASASWVYDDFDVSVATMDAADRTAVLPYLAPRAPGETNGDGKALRHVTVYRVHPSARPDESPPAGFVARGQLRVVDGDIVYTLALTPGQPYGSAGTATPVTVGEVVAAAYGNTTTANVDPLLRVADLAYIDA